MVSMILSDTNVGECLLYTIYIIVLDNNKKCNAVDKHPRSMQNTIR